MVLCICKVPEYVTYTLLFLAASSSSSSSSILLLLLSSLIKARNNTDTNTTTTNTSGNRPCSPGVALKRRDVVVPAAQGRQVEPAGRVVRHGAGGAALGRRADAAARLDVRVAVELLAVGRERGRVLHVRPRHVVAPVQVVDPVRAVARRVCAGADEDLLCCVWRHRQSRWVECQAGTHWFIHVCNVDECIYIYHRRWACLGRVQGSGGTR